MNKRTIIFSMLILLLLLVVPVVFAATTAPAWMTAESQTRMNNWFLQDQRKAIYSTLNDLGAAGGYWSTLGNAGTTAGTHFVGTTDNKDLVFKRNGTELFRLNSVGAKVTGILDVTTYLYNTDAGESLVVNDALDVQGGNIILQNDETISNSSNGTVTVGLPATGFLYVSTGNLLVGDGAHGQTLNGEDAYVEGLLEVDGVVYLDGGADLNGTTLTIDADADTTLAASSDDTVVLTLGTGGSWTWTGSATSPNLKGGWAANSMTAGVVGGTLVGGGYTDHLNYLTDNYGFVGGGAGNRAGNSGGGVADATFAAVVGGYGNMANGGYSFIGGGDGNQVSTDSGYGFVGGGDGNYLSAGQGSVIGGGGDNEIYAQWSFVGGGANNAITATAVITDDARYCFIGGGNDNTINSTGDEHAIVAGVGNVITGTGSYAFVGGGYYNAITGGSDSSVVVGGGSNSIVGAHSSVLGGYDNDIVGAYSTIAGGRESGATADYCFSAGRRAQCTHAGSFVWGDSSDDDVTSVITDSFNVEADGGLYLDGALSDPDSDLLVDDNLDVNEDLWVNDWVMVDVQTTVAITGTFSITPTGTFQVVSCGAAGGCTPADPAIVSGTTVGQILILQVTGTNDIVLTDDRNIQVGAATRTLTAAKGDTIMFIWTGVDWWELSFTDIN